jgi:hypothetical protein
MPGPRYIQVLTIAVFTTACFTTSTVRAHTDTPDTESWLEQGRALLSEGYFEAATDSYYRAFEINRADLGLYNRLQIPIIEQLLEAYLLTNNWSGFDRRLDYLEWLQPRILADDPVAHAEALSRLADWHVAAAARIHADKSAWHLIRARQLNWQAVTILQTHFGRDDLRQAPLLYKITLNHYYQMASIYRRGLTSFEFRSDQPVISNGWAYSLNENLRRSYDIGVELLTRIEQLHLSDANAPPEAAALARVYLADWHLLFGHGNRALAVYEDTLSSLTERGVTDGLINAYFDRTVVLPESRMNLSLDMPADQRVEPVAVFNAWTGVLPGVPLPENHPSQRVADHQQLLQPPSIPVTVTVNSGIRAISNNPRFSVDIAALTLDEQTGPATAQRAMHDLHALQFRPTIQNGDVIETQEVPLTYIPAPPRK